MSSDDSGVFIDCESPNLLNTQEEPSLDELYSHIPPPIPLIPQNKYKDVPLGDLKIDDKLWKNGRGPNEKNEEEAQACINQSDCNEIIDIQSIVDENAIVYQRDPTKRGISCIECKVKLDTLKNLPKFDLKPLPQPSNSELTFDSKFECGNLALVLKKSENEYDLLMQTDINTKGHTQWFYFKVQNPTTKTVKFNILNFSKNDSLFNYGMQIVIHSEKHYQKTKTQWFRGGKEISYFGNNIKRNSKGGTYYTLTFTYEFLYESDTVSFAYCYPYSYSRLLQDLENLEMNFADIVSRRTLCLSISDKRCELVTITAPGSTEEVKKRKGVVLSARVHPGESVASWMMKGVLEFLTSKSKEAKILREKYVFKILPMLNPDGVYYGNYRCGLGGSDLNRNWKTPSKILHPTIYASKKMIKSFCKERSVELICDFHGHSKRKNIFMYGCNIQESPEITRCFPYIISKHSSYFYYPYCSFRMQKSKEATMRISLFKETKIPLIYTLEASFFGGDYGEYKDKHYSTEDLMQMGKQVCTSLIIYNQTDDINNPKITSREKIFEELLSNKELLQDNMSDSSGSESEPSEDNLPIKELEPIIKITSSIKLLQTRKKNLKEIEKKSRSFSSKRDMSSKVFGVPFRKNKCGLCGEALGLGHTCQKKVNISKMQAVNRRNSVAYISASGKRVRDQATQTIKIEESKTFSPSEGLRINKTRLSKAFQSNTRSKFSQELLQYKYLK